MCTVMIEGQSSSLPDAIATVRAMTMLCGGGGGGGGAQDDLDAAGAVMLIAVLTLM